MNLQELVTLISIGTATVSGAVSGSEYGVMPGIIGGIIGFGIGFAVAYAYEKIEKIFNNIKTMVVGITASLLTFFSAVAAAYIIPHLIVGSICVLIYSVSS